MNTAIALADSINNGRGVLGPFPKGTIIQSLTTLLGSSILADSWTTIEVNFFADDNPISGVAAGDGWQVILNQFSGAVVRWPVGCTTVPLNVRIDSRPFVRFQVNGAQAPNTGNFNVVIFLDISLPRDS